MITQVQMDAQVMTMLRGLRTLSPELRHRIYCESRIDAGRITATYTIPGLIDLTEIDTTIEPEIEIIDLTIDTPRFPFRIVLGP